MNEYYSKNNHLASIYEKATAEVTFSNPNNISFLLSLKIIEIRSHLSLSNLSSYYNNS